MRGKAGYNSRHYDQYRITPAYAGKSTSFRKLPCSCQDHPRLCGEKVRLNAAVSANLGSPPPMRGKAVSRPSPPTRYRITPAYAGKRASPALLPEREQDHPRLCGEKFGLIMERSKEKGITPAYAGKRYSFEPATRSKRDHPRLCGEKS